ncbi:cell division protein FtsQ/DivIB [Pseudokordiimonas caeni]|uniref:cell division protein FtsQ/DivIB n=1 Tax=Pseudokordiimonas caeni TaxID=2997908 RepID=UPI002810E607|nr:cell division protein FtsQ/DivIB [Pseudokordiimonas caeni]
MTAMIRPRRVVNGVFFGLVLAALAYGGMQGWQSGWFVDRSRDAGFVLNDISVEGAMRTRQGDVLAALDVDTGMPILAIDLIAMKERLETLPWVKTAVVSRVFPGSLVVKVSERQPFALWQADGKVHLIDAEGIIITSRGLAEFTDLPLIVGAGATRDLPSLVTLLDDAPEFKGRIKSAVRIGGRRWDLVFTNGIRLKLPEDMGTYSARMAWADFRTLEKQDQLLAREIDVIDMRLHDRMVLRVSPAGKAQMDGRESAT